MKKNFLKLGTMFCVLIVFTGCGQIQQAKEALDAAAKAKDVNYRMFESQEETKVIFDEIVAKLGSEAKVTDEIKISISRRAHEGSIKKVGEADELNITIDTQDPSNPKRIRETRYWSDNGGWQPSQQMEVNVMGSSSAKESFRLEDELFDFNEKVNFETFFKVLTDAYAKYKDTEKYEYQYIKSININQRGYDVTIFGKLAANEQEKSNYYKANFSGKGK